MTLTNDQASPTDPADSALRSWDWKAALKADDRSLTWLARRTDKAQRTVYAYSSGELEPPVEWLRAAAAVLGGPA